MWLVCDPVDKLACYPEADSTQDVSTACSSAVHTNVKHEQPQAEATNRQQIMAAVVVRLVDINVTAQLHAVEGGACGRWLAADTCSGQ
jgi:hypothetical protein